MTNHYRRGQGRSPDLGALSHGHSHGVKGLPKQAGREPISVYQGAAGNPESPVLVMIPTSIMLIDIINI